MYVIDILALAILMFDTTPQIYGTKLDEIQNIKVLRDDLYFKLKWDPILDNEVQSKSSVRYSVHAVIVRYGRPHPDKIQLMNESDRTTIPFDVRPGREMNEWSFTVSASIDNHEIARGTKTYKRLTPPGIPVSLSPPLVEFTNDCQFLAVNLTAPNEQMKYKNLKYEIDFTSPTGMKIYDQKSLKPDMSRTSLVSINETAPMTARNVCVETRYTIYLDRYHSSPLATVCAACSDEDPKSQASSEKFIFIALIVASVLGILLFFSVLLRNYIKKNGTVQLPETIKQVITIKLRDAEGNTANHNRYESPMKIEPVEYEEELMDEAVTDEITASSSSIDETDITAENMPLLVDSGRRNFPEIISSVLADNQEAVLQVNTHETNQFRSTVTDDTQNNNIDRHVYRSPNGRVGDSSVPYISQKNDHAGSGYCEKYLPKHLIRNDSSGDASTFSDCVNGGYILKTCR